MVDLKSLHDEIKRAHDEISLKIHLGSRDLQDDWSRLEQRWKDFEAKAQIRRSTEDLGVAAELLGSELKNAYARIRNALN